MGQRLGVSRNLVSMMEKPEGGRAPSRSVKLLFEDLWAKHMDHERSDSVGALPPSAVREESPSYGGARARLKAARLAKGLSVEDFCKATGYSKLIYLGIEDGSSNMSRKMAERVAKVLDLPLEDLLDGSDHPPANGGHFGTVGETPDLKLPPGQKARFVPLLSMAQCGRMMAYDDTAYDHSGFLAVNPADGKAFAVTLAGDSMTPDFRPGDTAVVYPSSPPRNGSVVLARLNEDHGGDVMLKLYQSSGENVTLSSYNPVYPPMSYPRRAFAWIYPVASVTRVLQAP